MVALLSRHCRPTAVMATMRVLPLFRLLIPSEDEDGHSFKQLHTMHNSRGAAASVSVEGGSLQGHGE